MFSYAFFYLHPRVITDTLFFTARGTRLNNQIARLSSSRCKYNDWKRIFSCTNVSKQCITIAKFCAWRRHFHETRPLPITTTIPSLFSLRQFLVRVLHIFPDQGTRSIYRRIWLVDGRDINYILLGYWLHPRSYNSSWCWTAKLYRLSKSLGPRYSCFWVPLRNRISVG